MSVQIWSPLFGLSLAHCASLGRTHLMRSPWVSSFSKLWFGEMIDKAMSVFVLGMENFQSLSMTTCNNLHFSEPLMDISWFFGQFSSLYTSMTLNGLNGPNSLQAAKILLLVPIPANFSFRSDPFPLDCCFSRPRNYRSGCATIREQSGGSKPGEEEAKIVTL